MHKHGEVSSFWHRLESSYSFSEWCLMLVTKRRSWLGCYLGVRMLSKQIYTRWTKAWKICAIVFICSWVIWLTQWDIWVQTHFLYHMTSAASMAFSTSSCVCESLVNMHVDAIIGSVQVRSCGRHVDWCLTCIPLAHVWAHLKLWWSIPCVLTAPKLMHL